jgi:glycosyltransferase involved in cell wall biosynthesis
MKNKISGIVIVFNEEKHLSECLQSLSFCDEILVYDMGSTDNSWQIAESLASKAVSIPLIDFPEQVLGTLVKDSKNDWIICLDPDEVMPVELSNEIDQIIQSKTTIAKIYTPWRFFFMDKPIYSTVWGGEKYKDRVFNRNRVNIVPFVHQEIEVTDGFESYKIPFAEEKCIKHYWVDSIPEMFTQHWRYLKHEGEARFMRGLRFNLKTMLGLTYDALISNLRDGKGFKDGPRGIFLSFFFAWYVAMRNLSLLHYQVFKARKQNIAPSQ